MHNLYYYHDPMCGWCWGYRPVSDQLFNNLPGHVRLVYVLGGLAPDTDTPMSVSMQQTIKGYWQTIAQRLGTTFNYDFWEQCQPRRSTYPACRAVIAAGQQGAYVTMNDAIQQAYYLRAMNPSDDSTHHQLAKELGLDTQRFATDLQSEQTEQALQQDLTFTRNTPCHGFPSFSLEIAGQLHPVLQDYSSYQTTLDDIDRLLA